MSLRLTPEVDQLFRDRIRRRGDLTRLLSAILEAAELDTIELVELGTKSGQQTVEQTSFTVSAEQHQKLTAVSQLRECSINELINSAILSECQAHANCIDMAELEERIRAKAKGKTRSN